MASVSCDVAVIGGGIIGLATALALNESDPRLRIVVLEKESQPGTHQTGHNSGVIHAGIYYKPGSYKAKLCVEGVRLMKAFCANNAVPVENCGKVIVATSAAELPRLRALHERGVANGVPGLRLIEPAELHEIEPHARAVGALHSPETAIVDYGCVIEAMARKLHASGVEIRTSAAVRAVHIRPGAAVVESASGSFEAQQLVNCAGLHADRVARLAGMEPTVQIIPFRGEYYTLRPEQRVVRGLIYPVPDPDLPFLGVHFTKRIQGDYEAGPNAVLAFAREGYRWSTIDGGELAGMLAYRGFWRMAMRYWRTGIFEMYRSLRKKAFLHALQVLVPDLCEDDMLAGGSGVRAQAVTPEGTLVDDFQILTGPRTIHVLNAPSPAATASLAIGKHIAGLSLKSS